MNTRNLHRPFNTSMLLLIFHLFLSVNNAVGQEQGKTLLALGDSIADGQVSPGYVFSSGLGYNDYLFEKIQEEYGFDTMIDLACPGEDTSNFLNANPNGVKECFGASSPMVSLCYSGLCNETKFPNPFDSESQLQAAETYILNHHGEVGLVTIALGINEIVSCVGRANLQACAADGFAKIGQNLPTILSRLHAAFISSSSPIPPIVGMKYFNPLLAFYLPGGYAELAIFSELLLPQINDALSNIFDSFNGTTADAYTAVHGNNSDSTNGGLRNDVVRTCQYLGMCATNEEDGSYFISKDLDFNDGIHPNKEGYELIGKDFFQVIEKQDLLPTSILAPSTATLVEEPTSGGPITTSLVSFFLVYFTFLFL